MDFDFNKTSKNTLGRLGLYTLLMMCITALGIGSYAAMKRSLNVPETSTTVDWDNQGGTLEADKPEKEFTVTQTTTLPFTTEQSTTAKPEENLPFTGKFTLPLGTDILKDYSHGEMVSSKTMGDWRVHGGIDFTGSENSQVLAIQSGTVKAVYTDEMWGTVVEIDHGNTMVAKYCGLKEGTTPKKGATVRNGQEIGELAAIPVEEADGLHLHLEITVNGSTVDPLAAMNRAE
ncbi:MAG: M23 family metallopeptidase, partial [Clostridia bacterium]|nr:M23 family metallopeptidase [Clostridia bacterium]